MGINEIGWKGLDWISLVQDGEKWRGVVNTVWTFQYPIMRGISRLLY